MTNETLKPCWFCGDKAYTFSQNPKEIGYSVGCNNDKCRGFIGLSWIYATEAEAIAAWNTRHYFELTYEDYNILLDELGVPKRTCKNVDILASRGYFRCSECGMSQEYGIPNYCPNCGAKVLENKK